MALDLNAAMSLFLPLRGTTQATLKELIKGTGPLSFIRATTATRINPDSNLIESVASGDLREDGRQYKNILSYSEDFSNAVWMKSGISIAADIAAAPNSKIVADKMVEDTSTGTHYFSSTVMFEPGTYTISRYLKAAGRNWIRLHLVDVGTTEGYAYFNLANGTVGTTSSIISASIVPCGDGWYRCSITKAMNGGAGNPNLCIATADGTVSYTGDGISGVYCWGAQLEKSSSASRYVKTGSSPAYVPKGVLIEGQRTNLAVYSEQIDNAIWNNHQSTISANAVASPDGTMTADKIVETATASEHYVSVPYGFTDSLPYTWSACVKQGERTWCQLTFVYNDGTVKRAWFNLSAGVVGTVQAGITASISPAPNGFFRCSITTANIGIGVFSNRGYFLGVCTMDGELVYAGDITKGIYMWGAQVEQASFASSYIPTTAAAVTRNEDAMSIPSSGNLSASSSIVFHGALYFDQAIPAVWRFFLINNWSSGFGIGVQNDAVYYKALIGGTHIDPVSFAITTVVKKFGAVFTTSRLWFAGNQSSGVGGVPTITGDIVIGGSGVGILQGYIKNILVLNRALSDAEMIALTS